MIRIKYIPLFSIDFLHDFYTSLQCRDMLIQPSADCAAQMQQLGLRFRATDTGCMIFARVKEAGTKHIMELPLPENTRFTFLLFTRNTHFDTFSRLDLHRPVNQHYYFNNLTLNNGDGKLHLEKDTVNRRVGNTDLKKFVSGTYHYLHPSAVPETEVKLAFTQTGEELQQLINPASVSSRAAYSFDLKKGGTGLAELKVNNITQDNFYVAHSSGAPGAWGVIEIFHSASTPAACRFVDTTDQSVTSRNYVVHIANRHTTWRYQVSRKFNQAVTSVTIQKSNGGAISFSSQVSPPVPAGQFILFSDTTVPLTEAPVTGITMKDQASKEIFASLPNPPLHTLKEEGGKLFSDVFITI